MYLDKLANGINPVTDEPVSNDDCINNVRISRCLFYVSDVLRQLIENGGIKEKTQRANKKEFSLTDEDLARYRFEDHPISVSEIAKKINELADDNEMKKFSYKLITTFLIENGFLIEQETVDGKKVKVPTDKGMSIGISREERIGRSGQYHITVYDNDAQQFILDNLKSILNFNN